MTWGAPWKSGLPFNGGASVSLHPGCKQWEAMTSLDQNGSLGFAAGLHREELHESHDLCSSGPNYSLLQDAWARKRFLSRNFPTWNGSMMMHDGKWYAKHRLLLFHKKTSFSRLAFVLVRFYCIRCKALLCFKRRFWRACSWPSTTLRKSFFILNMIYDIW